MKRAMIGALLMAPLTTASAAETGSLCFDVVNGVLSPKIADAMSYWPDQSYTAPYPTNGSLCTWVSGGAFKGVTETHEPTTVTVEFTYYPFDTAGPTVVGKPGDLVAVTITDPWNLDLASWKDADHAFNAVQVVFDEPSAVDMEDYGTGGVLDDLAALADRGAAIWLIIIDSLYFDEVSASGTDSTTSITGRLAYLDAYRLADSRNFGEVVRGSGGGVMIANEGTGGFGRYSWFDGPSAVSKLTALFDTADSMGYKTQLMLYTDLKGSYPRDFGLDDAANEDIPQRVRDGVDLVTVSYYADDTNGGVQPPTSRLDSLFTLLRTRYPQAQLGRGECGTQYNARIPAEITACYGYAAPVEGYVTYGGWWYEGKFYAITNSTKRARHVAVTSALP